MKNVFEKGVGKGLCDRVMTISPIHTSMAEGPFPLQRIHNFPLRGRGTPGLRQGHNAPCPPGAHRSGCRCRRKRCSEVELACHAECARARGELTLTWMIARAFTALGSFRVFSASVKRVG